jgi:hypothetical protein
MDSVSLGGALVPSLGKPINIAFLVLIDECVPGTVYDQDNIFDNIGIPGDYFQYIA